MHLSYPVNDGNNRTAYKKCLKLSTETQKKHRLVKEGALANILERQ